MLKILNNEYQTREKQETEESLIQKDIQNQDNSTYQ